MFEKETKEHAEKILKGLHVMNGREWAIHDASFKDGAEFGYNKAEKELTKAKKIISNLYAICKDNHYPNSSVLMEQAEQFLKEVEK